MHLVNGALVLVGLAWIIALFVHQRKTVPSTERVLDIKDEHGNLTGKKNRWHSRRFVSNLAFLVGAAAILFAFPSPNGWWSFATMLAVLFLILVATMLTVAEWPDNEFGEFADRWTDGKRVDPTDPTSNYAITTERKRPAFRARFWSHMFIVGGLIVAWIVTGLIALGSSPKPSNDNKSPEAGATPAASAQASTESTKAAAPAPTPTATATKQQAKDCGTPTLTEVNETSPFAPRDYRVAVCKDGAWVAWTGKKTEIFDVEVQAKVTTAEYKYFRIVIDGQTYFMRYAFTQPEKSPAATGA